MASLVANTRLFAEMFFVVVAAASAAGCTDTTTPTDGGRDGGASTVLDDGGSQHGVDAGLAPTPLIYEPCAIQDAGVPVHDECSGSPHSGDAEVNCHDDVEVAALVLLDAVLASNECALDTDCHRLEPFVACTTPEGDDRVFGFCSIAINHSAQCHYDRVLSAASTAICGTCRGPCTSLVACEGTSSSEARCFEGRCR